MHVYTLASELHSPIWTLKIFFSLNHMELEREKMVVLALAVLALLVFCPVSTLKVRDSEVSLKGT